MEGFGSEGMTYRDQLPRELDDGGRRALYAFIGKYGTSDPYRPVVGDEFETDLSATVALTGISRGQLERMLDKPMPSNFEV